MSQLFFVSRQYGLATVVSGLAGGLFGAARRRTLILIDTAPVPEVSPSLVDSSAVRAFNRWFDSVYYLNADIAPYHPGRWHPRAEDSVILERLFRSRWELGDEPVHLIVESLQGPPAKAFATIFADARISVYGDGLMAYGPLRGRLKPDITDRIDQLVLPDLVDGVRPNLLREYGTPTRLIGRAEFVSVIKELAASTQHISSGFDDEPVGLVLGQYMAAMNILSADEELHLNMSLISTVAQASVSRVIFKAHPSSPPADLEALAERCSERRIVLTIDRSEVIVETLYASGNVAAVAACFSTGLATAERFYNIEVARAGTDIVLSRLRPFENSNRVPVVLADSIYSGRIGEQPRYQSANADDCYVQQLVDTVSYCMQPTRNADLRPVAETFLLEHASAADRYIPLSRRRLLGLPGAPPRWKPPYAFFRRPFVAATRERLSPVERLLRPSVRNGAGRASSSYLGSDEVSRW